MARLEIDVMAKGISGLLADIDKVKSASNGIKPININFGGTATQKIQQASDSILGMRNRLNELLRTYGSLTESQRNSARVQNNLIPEIKRLSGVVGDLNVEYANLRKGMGTPPPDSLVGMRNRLIELRKIFDNLTESQRNSSRVQNNLVTEIQRINQAVSQAEQATGRFQRNVGNYRSVLGDASGVTMEFNRIIQDAPYGMMGIGNNIQQLTANWQSYVTQARAAAAANGQTVSTGALLKGALSSIISPINLLTLGVSVLTSGWVLYDKWQQRSKKSAEEHTKKLQEQRNALDNYIATLDASSKVSAKAADSYASEIQELDRLFASLRNSTSSREAQYSIISDIQSKFPDYLGNLKEEDFLVNNGASAYALLAENILKATRARAAQELGGDAMRDRIKNEVALAGYIEETSEELKNLKKQQDDLIKAGASTDPQLANMLADVTLRINEITSVTRGYIEAIKESEKEVQSYTKIAQQNNIEQAKEIGILDALIAKRDRLNKVRGTLKTEAEIAINTKQLEEVQKEIDRLNNKQSKKLTSQADEVANAIIESNKRVYVAGAEGREKDIKDIENWYSSRLKLAEKNTSAMTILNENMRKEIKAVNDKYDNEELAAGREFMLKRQEQLADLGKKNAEQIKKDAIEEVDTSFSYQRRLFESRAQTQIKALNEETKRNKEALDKNLQDEIKNGADIVDTQKKYYDEKQKLQEDYYKKIEELTEQQRGIDIITSFDGSGTSIGLAAINDQMEQLKIQFADGQMSANSFLEKMSDLSVQREQLGLLQSSVDGVSSAFGDFFGDAIFDTENALENLGKAFENLAKNAISELIKIGVKQALNLSIGKAGLAASTVASLAAAKTMAAAWSPVAASVSLASFGANGIPAAAAISSTFALSKGLSLAGFSQGGYTGNSGVNEIAGIVHGREFVVNADGTRKNMALLQAMNSGIDVSSILQGSGVPSGARSAPVQMAPQRVDVVVHGEISGDTIKLVKDRADRNFNRFYGR